MGKFHVVYFGSNEVPVALIKPILDEIGADMTIRCPTNDAEVVEMGKDADGIIMHGSVPLTREIISQLKRCKVVCRTGVGVDRMDLKAAKDHGLVISHHAGAKPLNCTHTAAASIAFRDGPSASSAWAMSANKSRRAPRA